ncbi:MAG: sugar phosphate isomerase/epimerase family protein [Candidatus Merdivicinus sp.]|jgi:sugar phosphate isomerase/epimerase
MRIGISSECLMKRYRDERQAIRRYAELGISALDYSGFLHDGPDSIYLQDGWEEYAASLRRTADECGIIFSQAHAPMLAYGDAPAVTQRKMEVMRRFFHVCEILGAPYLVIHPRMFPDGINGQKAEEYLSLNVEFYRSLLPLAEKHHVCIALENMFARDPVVNRLCRTTFSTMEEILECANRLNSEYVAVCLDTGHSNIHRESPALAARKLGKRLKCLHVHDNWADRDDHLVCGYGNIDWDEFLEALKEIGYEGAFSSEASCTATFLPPEVAETAVKLIADVSRALLQRHGIPID